MVYLLDVNVLLALAWPNHDHHHAAHAWFGRSRVEGWATCPMTQAGFVRISCQPAVSKHLVPVHEAVQILGASTRSSDHHFWHQTSAVTSLSPELLKRVMGPQQLTDALLLELAIRHKGALATFDQRIGNLLPSGSPHHSRLATLPLAR
jgi:toxin-antitoxin system PIN domain toxin